MSNQRVWTPEQVQRRKDYLKAWHNHKHNGVPMPIKFYNREKEGWTTPAQSPIKILTNPSSTRKLVREQSFDHYHSPDPDCIRFNL